MRFIFTRTCIFCLTTILLLSIISELSAQNSRRRGRRGRDAGGSSGLKKGQEAPDFELKSLDGKTETKLSDLYAKKPVILFFGSYT